MVQRASKQDQQGTNGVSDGASPFLGSAPSHSMSFDAKEVVDISVANVSPADVTTKPSNGMQNQLTPSLVRRADVPTRSLRWIQN